MAYKPLNNDARFRGIDYKYTNVAERFNRERRRLKALAESEAKIKAEQAGAAARLAAELMEQAAADEAERLAKVAPMKRAAK